MDGYGFVNAFQTYNGTVKMKATRVETKIVKNSRNEVAAFFVRQNLLHICEWPGKTEQ